MDTKSVPLSGLQVKQHPSQNFGQRKHGLPPDMVVLHYTAMQTAQAAIERLCDPEAEVSAHYVISENGEITKLVDEGLRAWHAGVGAWGNVTDVNSHSIGIELANGSTGKCLLPFPAAQMDALDELLADVLVRNQIAPERVIAHSDMAPGRKFDPGPKFDWARLAKLGLSVWSKPSEAKSADWAVFKSSAEQFGYQAPETDTGWLKVLEAFRMRFSPTAFGEITSYDVGLIHELAEKAPCKNVDLGAPIA